MTNIYSDSIEVRIARVKRLIQARDYEGITTLNTSDIVELLDHIKKLEKKVKADAS